MKQILGMVTVVLTGDQGLSGLDKFATSDDNKQWKDAVSNFKMKNDESFDENDFIFVKSNLKKRKVFLNDLKYIVALGDYVKLVTENDSLIVLKSGVSKYKLLISRGGNDSWKHRGDANNEASTR